MTFATPYPLTIPEEPATKSERDFLVTGRHTAPHRELQLPLPSGSVAVIDTPASCVFNIPASESQWLCLIPLAGEGRFFHDGIQTPLQGFSISAPGRGVIFRSGARGSFLAVWLSATATSVYRALPKADVSRKVRVFERIAIPAAFLQPPGGENPTQHVRDAGELGPHTAALETALLAALEVGWQAASSNSVPRRSSARLEIVQSIWDTVRADPLADISLEDWSRMAESSPRTVEYAFTELTGLSPMAFIRVWRFARARQLLLEGRVKAVKDAAYGCGLMHLGRFSIDYRLQFGESPSETLARTRAAQGRISAGGNLVTPGDFTAAERTSGAGSDFDFPEAAATSGVR